MGQKHEIRMNWVIRPLIHSHANLQNLYVEAGQEITFIKPLLHAKLSPSLLVEVASFPLPNYLVKWALLSPFPDGKAKVGGRA